MSPRKNRRERILILGAAGRDFHDFNVRLREDADVEVVAFTAAQIPGIRDRRYPPALSGAHHPDGIPIEDEVDLERIVAERRVDRVVLAYSDLDHVDVMHLASRALAAGADWSILGPRSTMLESGRPVIAVSAVRTGCGKSQTSRWIVDRVRARGLRVAAIRHPMPYGDLERQLVQRFASLADIDSADCTAEEREEYEPYIERGAVIFSGVDYAAILSQAEREADVIVWDGGNNDWPFVRPDLHIALVDALRPEQIATHHPGETVLRCADVVVVNKVEAAGADATRRAIEGVRAVRPEVPIVRARSPVVLDDASRVAGRRVVVVDDGPTLTHGGMPYGAGWVAAMAAGAEIVDPRSFAAPVFQEAFRAHPHLGAVLPALGYDGVQIEALQKTLGDAPVDCIVSGTPLDLAHLVKVDKPIVRARYEFGDGTPSLAAHVDRFLDRIGSREDEGGTG